MARPPSSSPTLALIGAACRFPGPVYDLDAFHDLLHTGRDAVTEIPPERFSLDRFFSAAKSLPGHGYTTAAGILPDILDFDPEFFGISRTEALDMDPQQRMLLEMTWEALENAGILPSSLRGSETGVYMGVAGTDTALRNTDDVVAGSPYTMTGSTLSIASNRVSYFFDFHGPSLSVDTACSSSLVALHMACEALRNGEIPLAVVGGINCLLAPHPFMGFSKARMLSPDGRCKVFDASGNGYVRGEGGGVVLVTTLDHARRNKWEPLALIAGTGVNSDGRTTGIAQPNPEAQAALIRHVYDRFDLDQKKLVYVEAHGTGTSVGDPLEASAIGRELGRPLAGVRTLPVGSVKTNIGHLETSAGMAGLLKALLVLRHEEIPPNLHFETPNPAIDFEGSNILVPTKSIPLPRAGGGELVSINSFGFGGTNAHVVLRKPDHPRKKRRIQTDGELPPLLLSARSAESLRTVASRLAERLENADVADYGDLASGLAFKRDHLDRRAMAAGKTVAAVREDLLSLAADEKTGDIRTLREDTGSKYSGVFAFSGNGSQWSGMGRSLLAEDSAFKQSIEETDAILSRLQGWSLLEVLREPDQHPDAFTLTEKSQSLIFAVQVGIVQSLAARGIFPSAVIGHSVGEVAAAWCSGALSLEDAALSIHVRSMLQAPLHGTGGMAAANMSEEAALEILAPFQGKVEIAAVNTPTSLSLAGDTEALREVVALCKKRRIAAKLLDIPYPFHTHFMEAIQEDMGSALSAITPRKPRLPFFSSVLGKAPRAFVPDAAYWRRNVRQPVLFSRALREAHAKGYRLFMEIGPSPVLRSYIRDNFKDSHEPIFITQTLNKGGNEAADLDAVRKNAWLHGWKLDLDRLFSKDAGAVELPVYPWNRHYCWRESSPEARGYVTANRTHPLLGWQLPGKAPVFENTIHTADFPWLDDHIAGNRTVYPATAFIESMLAAGKQLFPEHGMALERVALFRPLSFPPDTARALRLTVDREDGGVLIEGRAFNSAEDWGTYAKGRLIPSGDGAEKNAPFSTDSPEEFGAAISKEDLYAAAARCQLHYGPAFRVVANAWLKPDTNYPEVLAELRAHDISLFTDMLVPPTLTDGAFHTLFLLLGNRVRLAGKCFLPSAFDRITLVSPGTPRYAHAKLEKVSARSIVASFRLYDRKGKPILLLQGCRFRRAAWLEQENTPSAPYATTFFRVPHPETVCMPRKVSLALLRGAAGKIFGTSKPEKDTDSRHYPWLLLQLASLAAARETVLSLRGQADQHTPFSCEELLASGALSPQQEPWLRHLLERLKAADFASLEEGSWLIPAGEKRRDATTLWRTALAAAPEQACEATLLSHVYASGHTVLRGDFDDAQANILPSSLEQAYYANACSLKPGTDAAREAVRAAMKATACGEEFRILYYGKNPESFLAPLEPYFAKGRGRFTVAVEDPSEAEAGNARFGTLPGVRFIPFSLEDSEETHAGWYHCILCDRTLRDNLNVALSLERCRGMLADNGILMLLEQPPSAFTDYVFGSRLSWWSASARLDQPVSLLQTRESWEETLRMTGFTDIETLGSNHEPSFLLLARKNAVADAAPEPHPLSDKQQDTCVPSPRRWIIAGRAAGTASADLASLLDSALCEAGETVSLLLEDSPLPGSEPEARFDPGNAEHWQAAAANPNSETAPCVIYLGGYDTDETPGDVLERTQIDGLAGLTALARAWEHFGKDARLWVVSGGAFGGGFPDERPVPSQGVVLGFTRVLANELRSARVALIDVHGDADTLTPEGILRELLFPTDEPEVILTREKRFVPRLAEYNDSGKKSAANADTSVTLDFDHPGRLRNLFWKQGVPPLPGVGEVRVNVTHTGLNFRDVMWSMGLLPDEALENGFSGAGLGIECSGVIDAVGKNVTEWSIGDAVLCFAPSCFSSHIVTLASAVAAKPANISFSEAATIPVAFITAWYALHHLARLERGQRVLIHGAAGGVGLAAIQIAAHMGLEIHATAGAAEKHHFLQRLGVTRLYSSRTLSFAREVMDATNGEGVDCVLNSLSGEAGAASIGLLRPFGQFIELGKRDFFADSPMRLRPFSNNLTYYGVDVDQLLIHKPELARRLFAELMALFEQRKLVPLPHAVYPSSRAVDAFQAMQQAAHIGKLVVSMAGAAKLAKPATAAGNSWQVRPDATYLVSGGNSGLGLAAAGFLARRGARHILLVSRRGVTGEEDRAMLTSIQCKGVNVIDAQADVTDRRKLSACLKKELATLPPLGGVIHAAAVLDDGMIASLTPDRLGNSLAAKAMGAWNLHEATKALPLDFFVLFSSATTVFGNPGQAGYIAANCMLETLAAWRKKQGLPAQVIGWGPIGDTGMLLRNPKARQLLLQRLGITPTSSSDAMRWLERCITGNISHSAYFSLNWHNRADLAILAAPRFSLLRPFAAASGNEDKSSLEAIRAASPQEGVRIVAAELLHEVAAILRLPVEKIPADTPLAAQGMDSLMAVELALAVEQKFELAGYTLPLTDKTTAQSLATSIYALIMGGETPQDQQLDIVVQMTQKHGAHLSDAQHDSIMQTISGDTDGARG